MGDLPDLERSFWPLLVPDISKRDSFEHVFGLDSYAIHLYNCGMLSNSNPAGCHVQTLPAPWSRPSPSIQGRTAKPAALAMKDTLIASAFLCGYMTLYLAVGFVGLSAVEWVWTYVTR
jgi:hypothetical protein